MVPCSEPTIYRSCPQEAAGGACYYHRKVRAGLLQPAHVVLDTLELEATMEGRLHGDGRRLDSYVLETHRLVG